MNVRMNEQFITNSEGQLFATQQIYSTPNNSAAKVTTNNNVT